MSGRQVQAGDFVEYIGGNEAVHAIRSINPDGSLTIYPLNDQRNEKILFRRNGQWVIGGENVSHTLRFIEYIPWTPPEGIVFGRERFKNIENTPNLNNFIDYQNNKDVYIAPRENIEEVYDDFSIYQITKEQYLVLLILRIKGLTGNYDKAQVEWLLKSGLFPPTYDFGWIIQHEDLDMIKRVDRVSQATRIGYSDIIELLWSEMVEEPDPSSAVSEGVLFILNLSRYLSDKGIYPDEEELEFSFRRGDWSIPLIKVLIEKDAILDPQRAIELADESNEQEIVDLFISAYQPTKSAMKR